MLKAMTGTESDKEFEADWRLENFFGVSGVGKSGLNLTFAILIVLTVASVRLI